MPERWESELAKTDSLGPDDRLSERVGSVPTPDRTPDPGKKIVTIAAAFLLFIVGGSFAWRALSEDPAAPADDPRDGLYVTCGPDGAEVDSPAAVGPNGLYVNVRNLSGVDEVVIVGPGWLGDMDLSEKTKFTFTSHLQGGVVAGPGSYLVGCYTDADVPSGTIEEIRSAPGWVPVDVVDPEGFSETRTAEEAWARVDELKARLEEAFSAETPPSAEERAAWIHDVSEAVRYACEVDPDHPNCT
jgi:hypothetical protein